MLCSQYLVSLGFAWAERGMGTLYISILGLQEIVPLGAIYLPQHPTAH